MHVKSNFQTIWQVSANLVGLAQHDLRLNHVNSPWHRVALFLLAGLLPGSRLDTPLVPDLDSDLELGPQHSHILSVDSFSFDPCVSDWHSVMTALGWQCPTCIHPNPLSLRSEARRQSLLGLLRLAIEQIAADLYCQRTNFKGRISCFLFIIWFTDNTDSQTFNPTVPLKKERSGCSGRIRCKSCNCDGIAHERKLSDVKGDRGSNSMLMRTCLSCRSP